jgi:hypothetical protein
MKPRTLSAFTKKARKAKFGYGPLLLCLAACGVIIWFSTSFLSVQLHADAWKLASGKVASVRQSKDDQGRTIYVPTVLYVVNNIKYRVEIAPAGHAPAVGASQDVRYDPNSPGIGVAPPAGNVLLLGAMIFAGIVGVVASIVFFMRSVSKAPEPKTASGIQRAPISLERPPAAAPTQVAHPATMPSTPLRPVRPPVTQQQNTATSLNPHELSRRPATSPASRERVAIPQRPVRHRRKIM